MVAEGYNASKCIFIANKTIQAEIPIATIIYQILWEQLSAEEGFKQIEELMV
jgi:glycerol-3-phosphate dehydrogenase (NAD(P)+)